MSKSNPAPAHFRAFTRLSPLLLLAAGLSLAMGLLGYAISRPTGQDLQQTEVENRDPQAKPAAGGLPLMALAATTPQPAAQPLPQAELSQPVPTQSDSTAQPPAAGPIASAPEVATEQAQPAGVYAAPSFDGRPLRPVKTLRMVVTAYSPDARSCGKSADGITASGYSVETNGMLMVAADTKILPFGTLVSIPGYAGEKPVPVLDRGGLIKGHCLDVLYPTHEIARQWGRQTLDVTVWEYADEQAVATQR